jgi:hypothetical protein
MSYYGESQFENSQFSELLQLVNAWPVELWGDYVHS